MKDKYRQHKNIKKKPKDSESIWVREVFSNGQQQMLAVARGLMAKPEVLLLDEPSLGLSPLMRQ